MLNHFLSYIYARWSTWASMQNPTLSRKLSCRVKNQSSCHVGHAYGWNGETLMKKPSSSAINMYDLPEAALRSDDIIVDEDHGFNVISNDRSVLFYSGGMLDLFYYLTDTMPLQSPRTSNRIESS